jgi:hypothetical protein
MITRGKGCETSHVKEKVLLGGRGYMNRVKKSEYG